MWRIAVVFMLGAGMALASSLGLPNELVNGGFEEWGEQGPIGWEGDTGKLSQSTDNPPEGQYTAQALVGYTSAPNEGEVWQIEPVPVSGPYIIDLSGWVKRYCLDGDFANHPEWGWIEVMLTVDGEPIWSETFPADDQWHYFEYITPEPVWVNEFKDIHILWGNTPEGSANYRTFDNALMDGFDKEEILVPEPGTIALLLSGLAGIAALRRK